MRGTDSALLAASVNIADGAIKSDLTHIHGTALTETAGQLAAAFKKLFDVATPLLVASDVMKGTDSAALASVLGTAVGATISADIADLPTVAEFEARTIVSADYVVVGDTIAGVTLTDTVTTYTGNTKQTGDNFAIVNGTAGLVVIDTVVDAIKVIADALTAAGAAKLALGATTMITGTVSWDNTNATTTVIYSDDIIEATADHFNGRLFVPTSGALLGQYTDITDYALDTGEGKFTVTALTSAPAENTTFMIL